jgi:PAS domain S-box-containing protein
MDRTIQELTWEHNTIIDSSSDGLFVCDGQGEILRVNPASERINQATAEQLVGRNYLDVAKEGLVILPSAALEAIKQRKQVSLLQENRFGRKLISTATPVFADDGELIRVVVSERDITEIDRLQKELEEQQAIGDQFRQQILELQQAQLNGRSIIAESPAMVKAIRQALKLGKVDSTVLILGESGVGKGLIADLIHQNSNRADKPIIKLNCGAIPELLIEAELFGYVKGAFTGAAGNKPGLLEIADGGTIFLDEIAELPLASQVKLLRFMEDNRITRLGSTQSRHVDVRILTATNQNLQDMMDKGLFRADLYYRLSVIPLQVPPLRERKDCLLPLIRSYIDLFSKQTKKEARLTTAAIDTLSRYTYPGNVRELMNICERLVVMTETDLIDVVDLPQTVVSDTEQQLADWPVEMSMMQIMETVERNILLTAAKKYHKQQDIAAGLSMSQPTVARKLQKYGIGSQFGRNRN